jgi:hypothetical protein
MAFVNEAVPEEQKSKFDPKVFYQGVFHKPVTTRRWVIDREQDAFLILLGGGGREPEIPYNYALSWKGVVIKFDAVQTADGSKEKGWSANWMVSNMRIPPALEPQRQEVLQLLREGLDAMGTSICRRDNILAVSVHFQ